MKKFQGGDLAIPGFDTNQSRPIDFQPFSELALTQTMRQPGLTDPQAELS
jgi:hypothetical protein